MQDLLVYVPYCGTPPLPAEIWSRWNSDPILMAALAALFAWHGVRIGAWHAASHASATRRSAFYLGWFALALGLLSPICALSVSLFSARLTQHMWLVAIAAPVLALAGFDARNEPARKLTPFTAAGLFAVALWAWHWPALYAQTFASDLTYWAMHITLTGTAILLWRALLVPAREHALARVVAGFVTLTHMGLLGALIAFAPRPLYTPHLLTAPVWKLTALEDQQLGGLIMWIPASVVFLVVALVTAYSVVRETDSETKPAPAANMQVG